MKTRFKKKKLNIKTQICQSLNHWITERPKIYPSSINFTKQADKLNFIKQLDKLNKTCSPSISTSIDTLSFRGIASLPCSCSYVSWRHPTSPHLPTFSSNVALPAPTLSLYCLLFSTCQQPPPNSNHPLTPTSSFFCHHIFFTTHHHHRQENFQNKRLKQWLI